MKNRNLAALVAAAATLLLVPLAPAVAADPEPVIHPGPIVVPRLPVVSGVPEPYDAELWIGTDRLRNEPLELQVKESGETAFETVGTSSTGVDGHQARVVATLTYDAELRWFHPATAKAPALHSIVLTERVRPRVGAVVNDRTLRTGQALVVTGRVRPAKPGRIVRLWAGPNPALFHHVRPPARPVLLATAYIRGDGSYRLVRRFQKPGQRQLFVTVPETFRNAAGWSSYRYVRVR